MNIVSLKSNFAKAKVRREQKELQFGIAGTVCREGFRCCPYIKALVQGHGDAESGDAETRSHGD